MPATRLLSQYRKASNSFFTFVAYITTVSTNGIMDIGSSDQIVLKLFLQRVIGTTLTALSRKDSTEIGREKLSSRLVLELGHVWAGGGQFFVLLILVLIMQQVL